MSRTIENALDIKYLQDNGVPFVVIGSYNDSTVYQVDVNQQAGCQDLTEQILKMGMRKIALFCGDMTHVVTKSRMKGFCRHMRKDKLILTVQKFSIILDMRKLLRNKR